MESAKLMNQAVNLQLEFSILKLKGHRWDGIRKILNDKYRKLSDIDSFLCSCCDRPVKMVLRQDAVHFRHDGDPCPLDQNYRRYDTSREVESPTKFQIGKHLLREYLIGQLSIHQVNVQDGYSWLGKMDRIPDFLLEFPNGDRWCIDYITGVRDRASYTRTLTSRLEAYQKQGFTPFFFIDHEWMKILDDFPRIVSISSGEKRLCTPTVVDRFWSRQMNEWMTKPEGAFLIEQTQYELAPFPIGSLNYINIDEREVTVIRTIPYPQEKFKFGYLVTEPITLPLERALSLDHKGQFSLYAPDERERAESEHQLLLDRLKQAQQEAREKEERHRKYLEEQDRLRLERENARLQQLQSDREASINRYQEVASTAYPAQGEGIRTPAQMQRDINMRNRRLEAGVNPDHYGPLPALRYSSSTGATQKKPLDNQRNEKQLKKWRDQFLQKRFQGEGYINGPTERWKEFLLNHYEELEAGKLNANQVVEKLKTEGITFNQKPLLVELVLNEVIQYLLKSRYGLK